METFPVVLLAGLSGGGKTSAINVLEDMRFFAIDGLPLGLVPQMLSLLHSEELAHYKGLAIGLDISQQDADRDYVRQLLNLRGTGDVRLVFIEASHDVIMRRYATTRRPHPLESEGLGLEQAIRTESERLLPLRNNADLVIDTSSMSIHDLRRFIQKRYAGLFEKSRNFRVHLISFGFKYGLPAETDMMYDLRFLPNPFFVEDLRPMSGKDEPIRDYVLESEPGKGFMLKLRNFLEYLLPLFENEGRYRVTIAFGCTGGRHRSVAVTEAAGKALKENGYAVSIEHRHLELG
ncbi:RNase adapter RapZ [Desulfovibrio sp. OttesenSCG-928-C06]|nr:RNase adapter RapZ [Desulfovibrio sp. OttesenSCG-928-C06]